LEILKFYAGFEIHDHTGLALTDDEMTELHCKKLTNLQVDRSRAYNITTN